ncbi:mevalonate kinase [Ligilactobacillus equi]|uniref:mevalonate kinase n=1 Tax=Ligilactobacillus equi TaxID=137357 RepID=UPI002ED4DB1D
MYPVISGARGTSHAKIILMGEHAVVYGQPAIALPLLTVQTQVTVTTLPCQQFLLESDYYSGAVADLPTQMQGFKDLIMHLITTHPNSPGFKLTLTSQLPAERGMGSSAAVAVALVKALTNFYQDQLSHDELLDLANIAEKATHKNPSGLDAATAASNQPIWLIRGQKPRPIPIKMNAYLVICDSGIKGQTSQAIQIVKKKLIESPQASQTTLTKLGQLAYKSREFLAKNQIQALGQAFDAAHHELQKLGVSLPALDNLITIAHQNGSLGSKLTGGGRGGCFINLLPDYASAKNLAAQLKAAGARQIWIQALNQLN